MATNYPSGIDSLTNPSAGDALTSPSHSAQHANANDAIEAIETELGTTPSGSYDTVKARFEAIEGSTLPQVDAKGDLIVGTADNTYDNLGVGTNDTVLLAASGETKGVKWAQVPTAAIQDDAVTAAKIAANAVGASELADNAVDTAAVADSAITTAKVAAGAVTYDKLARQPGNLLSENQASGGDASGDTTGWGTDGVSITYQTNYAVSGAGSIQAIAGSNGVFTVGIPAAAGNPVVTPGQAYTFTASVRPIGEQTLRLYAVWRAADGVTYVGESMGAERYCPDSTWTTLTETFVAPAGAATVHFWVRCESGVTDQRLNIDQMGLWKGAAGTWQPPGVPIPGQSHIATNNAVHLSGTGTPEGVVVAAPGSTWLQTDATTDVKGWLRWIKATGTGNTGWVAGPEADTGMRDVSASLLNGWTGSVITRRIGNAVTLWLVGLAAGSDGHALTLPSGFRDACIATMPFGVQKAGADTGVGLAVGAITWDSKVVLPTSGATNLIGEVHLTTADTWPTSLPGSAA